MAKMKMIKDNIWLDDYFLELTPEEKTLFFFLITNPEVNLAGIYQIGVTEMSFRTGLSIPQIRTVLDKFSENKKIYYIDGWVFVSKLIMHQAITNPNTKKGIERIIRELPSDILEKIMPLGLKKSLEHMAKINDEDLSILLDSVEQRSTASDSVEQHPTRPNNLTKLNLTKLNSKEIYTEILEHWNTKQIIVHKQLGVKAKKQINNLLKEFELKEIKKGIDVYSEVLKSPETFWTYKWTLEEFLQRQNGLRVFAFKTFDDYLKKRKEDDSSSEDGGYV